ncbi:MAG TPA: LLM class flavin-dependent oxidoreductase [Candidatus Dormibacteraeota bacterium]|nr:LLM class flavin-dependent oxidoreductase [Candidatus Dormibacteraeota bacterium]
MKNKVRFGCRIFLAANEPFQQIIKRAQFCEKHGFDSVLIDDHLLYGTEAAAAPEPFTTLAAIAAGTHRIRVGIAVTDLVRRHPAILAQTLATLSNQYPKRVFLGVGAGDPMNQSPFGLFSEHRVGRLSEGLKIILQLWNSSIDKPQSFKGRFFTLNNAYLQAGQEKQPVPPIYLAAFGPRMLRLAGEAADGWIPHCHTPSTYKMDLDTIIGSAHNAGRDFGVFRSAYYTLSSISTNRAEADRNVLGPARYFLALIPEALKKINPLANHPGRIWEKISNPKEQREIIRKIAAEIPESDAYNTVIHGTADDCIEQIEGYQKAGCKEFMLTLVSKGGLWSTTDLLEQMRLFSDKVMSNWVKVK